jgi:predicted acetylornithine/succinylornithine family transaminase
MPLSSAQTQEMVSQYLTGNYMRAPISMVRGEGSYLWDAEGKRYLDLLPGLGVDGLGHAHPKVVKALSEQAGKLLHIHNNYLIEGQAHLAKALIDRVTGMGAAKAFFCNSGTEASEAGIKLSRLWGKQNGGKWKIITLENGFHGRTYGALSATGQPKFHLGCEPILPGFSYVPINNLDALAKAFDSETVAFIAEPVQGEGGIFPCTTAFLTGAKELCQKHGALLLYDEVQSGGGRTGDFYAYQTLKAPAPDILWLAKSLGGGFPIGAMIARPEVALYLKPGTHGTTYGGNPLACAAGLAVIETIEQEKLIENVRAMADVLNKLLKDVAEKFPQKVKEIRQVGLMAALDLTFPCKPVVDKARENGVLVNGTHDTVVRFLPAMNVNKAQLEEGVAVVAKALAEV